MYIGTQPYSGIRARHTYTATANQTSFSGAGAENVTLTYADELYIDVYQNGVKLSPADYTATSGTTVVLAQGASVNDIVEVIKFDAFSVADTVSAKDGGGFGGNISTSGTLAVTGNATVGGTLGVTGDITLSNIAGGAVFNEGGADVDFRVESDTVDHALFVDGASGNVGMGVVPNSSWNSSWTALQLGATGFVGQYQAGATDVTALGSNVWSDGAYKYIETDEAAMIKLQNGTMIFDVAVSGSADAAISFTTAMTILNNSKILVGGLTTSNDSLESLQVYANGKVSLSVARQQDGTLVHFRSGGVNGAAHGEISISGTTCSYGAFTGTHWSRLSDNTIPTILLGTVIETIDEMCDWYQAEFTVEATDEEDEYVRSESIGLPSGKSEGDTITHKYEGTDYTATIIKEGDNKHTKCKISDTADSKSVYGVFCAWDLDDDTVNDMKVASLGTHVVRIHKDVTVSKGDLIVSNGDGTAKVQDDDIIRSKTIGKVLTNIKQETYDDDSYTVPCALYCG
jgi:hypothetical protein